ncbi:MAG TPA: peptidylprolyl isomerase [Nitrospirales bacterium]|jgi:parvulin-like peptidyl-prolyl isomerase
MLDKLLPYAARLSGTGLFLLASLFLNLPAAWSAVRDRIVAVINTEVITQTELEEEVNDVKTQARQRFKGPELDRRLRQIDYMGINRMIERKLQIQIAKRRGIKVTDEEVKDAIARLRRLGEAPNENDPKEMASIKDQLTALRIINQQVRSSLMVSDEELHRFYEQHQERFLLPPEVRISQILIALGPGTEMLQVREKVQRIYASLKKGERFEELAAQHSEGPEGRRGGSLGFVRIGDMLPQIQNAIQGLSPGQSSEPIASPLGMHIIRVDELKPAQYRPFDEVREDIRNAVYQLKSEDAYQAWIKNLKDQSYIEVRL